MTNQWILDVLADLRAFARLNGLENLAQHLDETCVVAAAELAGLAATGEDPERLIASIPSESTDGRL